MFSTGKRRPESNLFTRMRSPISSVGNIELDGILKGSTIKERTMNTASRTGKKPAEYSSQTGRRKASFLVCASAWPAARRRRRGRKNSLSAHHTLPVTSTRMEKISVKFIFLPFSGVSYSRAGGVAPPCRTSLYCLRRRVLPARLYETPISIYLQPAKPPKKHPEESPRGPPASSVFYRPSVFPAISFCA